MPAIHLPRLRTQVAELVLAYAEPDLFVRKLRDLFNYYGDRTRRVSRRTARPTGLPTVNLPQPVIKEVITQLTPYAQTAPHAVLTLAQTLWASPMLENRLLSAHMLGKLPLDESTNVLILVTTWCRENHEEAILTSLATHSLATIQKENSPLFLDQVQTWLTPEQEEAAQDTEAGKRPTPSGAAASTLNLQKLALIALPPLIQNPQFENLPRIYSIIDPVVSDAPKLLRPYILDVMRLLALRTPPETAYLLKKHLTENPSLHVRWLARRVYTELPQEFHSRLYPLIFDKGEG